MSSSFIQFRTTINYSSSIILLENQRPITPICLCIFSVEELEYELMLNSTTAEMFKSTANLREAVEKTMTEMMQVENNDLFEGERGDIKFDLLAATSKHYQIYPFGSRTVGLGFKTSDYDVYIDMGMFIYLPHLLKG